jgi:hypothetical protein
MSSSSSSKINQHSLITSEDLDDDKATRDSKDASSSSSRETSCRSNSSRSRGPENTPHLPFIKKGKAEAAEYYYFSVTIPAALLCAAGICWHDPMKFPVLFFVFLALGFIRSDSLWHASKQVVVRYISDGITLSFALFARDEQQSNRFMQALSETIRVALTNEQLTATFKEMAIDTIRDEHLQAAILDTMSAAIVRAMQDENFKAVVLSAVQQGCSDALSNMEFMDSMFDAIVEAIISASENIKLRKALLDVSTEAVSTAVRDERFMNELKQVFKECLRDSELFRAGVSGFIGAMKPGGGGSGGGRK